MKWNQPSYIREYILLLSLLLVASCASNNLSRNNAQIPRKANSQMASVLDALLSLKPKPIEKLTPIEARKQPSPSDGVFQLLQNRGTASPEKLPTVGKIELKNISGFNGATIPLKIYTPRGVGPFPIIVYYHGGGWVIGSIEAYDSSCRALSSMAGAIVISVDYRLAPEFKFPTAHEDSYSAFQYIAKNAIEFNGIQNKVAVAGESAGGNLAAAVCLLAKKRGGIMPVHQLLIYPIANYGFSTPSYLENADAKPLNLEMMKWFFSNYLNTPEDGNSILISLVRSTNLELQGLPSATVITAEIDPLRSEGESYAEMLKLAGVEVAAQRYAGVTHEFFGMGAVVNEALSANMFATSRLKEAFKK